MKSFNYPKTYIRHRDGLGFATEINSELGSRDSSWYLCPGLAGGKSVSFRSVNYPKQYLRHQEGRVKLCDFEDTDLFKNDASFHRRAGLAKKDCVSFESVNYPGKFIRHRDGELWVEANDGSGSFAADATFRVVATLKGAAFPVTGKKTRGVELLDEVMLHYMERIDCSAATLAIAYQGVLVHSRGYGWSDEGKTRAAAPDTMIGIASCEKPITSAMIRQLARTGRLDLNAGLFKLLKIEPRGRVIDDRVR